MNLCILLAIFQAILISKATIQRNKKSKKMTEISLKLRSDSHTQVPQRNRLRKICKNKKLPPINSLKVKETSKKTMQVSTNILSQRIFNKKPSAASLGAELSAVEVVSKIHSKARSKVNERT